MSVLQRLDTGSRKRVLELCIQRETSAVLASYDGTYPSLLTAAVTGLQRRATGVQPVVTDILEVLCYGELFAELGLHDMDAIVVQRMGRHIVRIDNTKEDRPASGCTVFIEVNDVRLRAKNLLTATLKANATDNTIASDVATKIACVVVGGGLFFLVKTVLDRLCKLKKCFDLHVVFPEI
jgi:hypothetical protein